METARCYLDKCLPCYLLCCTGAMHFCDDDADDSGKYVDSMFAFGFFSLCRINQNIHWKSTKSGVRLLVRYDPWSDKQKLIIIPVVLAFGSIFIRDREFHRGANSTNQKQHDRFLSIRYTFYYFVAVAFFFLHSKIVTIDLECDVARTLSFDSSSK